MFHPVRTNFPLIPNYLDWWDRLSVFGGRAGCLAGSAFGGAAGERSPPALLPGKGAPNHALWISRHRSDAKRARGAGSDGQRRIWQNFKGHRAFDEFTPAEAAFIAERDSFYMATVSETGWPYVQHRGGPPGFLKVVDEKTLAFADYRGNRQYLSVGNLAADDRAALILVDYSRRARLKILAHVKVVALDADPALAARVAEPTEKAKPERIFVLHLDAFDWNCPQPLDHSPNR